MQLVVTANTAVESEDQDPPRVCQRSAAVAQLACMPVHDDPGGSPESGNCAAQLAASFLGVETVIFGEGRIAGAVKATPAPVCEIIAPSLCTTAIQPVGLDGSEQAASRPQRSDAGSSLMTAEYDRRVLGSRRARRCVQVERHPLSARACRSPRHFLGRHRRWSSAVGISVQVPQHRANRRLAYSTPLRGRKGGLRCGGCDYILAHAQWRISTPLPVHLMTTPIRDSFTAPRSRRDVLLQ